MKPGYLWVDFHGRFYNAKGAILEPKPIQKPHPPLLFGGFSSRMLRLAGRYGDICYIPPSPWNKIPFNEAKSIVEVGALKSGREGQIAYVGGLSYLQDPQSFDMTILQRDIEQAAKNGCEFYITPFPLDKYLAAMEQFAKDLFPSYAAGD